MICKAENKLQFSVITPVSDGLLYARSMDVSRLPTDDLISIGNAESAAAALNYGMRKAKYDLCVCCHQDVAFPPFWADGLLKLPEGFGVVGLYGMDLKGNEVGHVNDPHGYRMKGIMPCEAQTVDELCIIIDRRNGLQFDEELGGWHMYGADICLAAMQKGLKNYVINNLVLHGSGGKMNSAYYAVRGAFVKKWQGHAPVRELYTTCGKILL